LGGAGLTFSERKIMVISLFVSMIALLERKSRKNQ
jgi:hypothetical protein